MNIVTDNLLGVNVDDVNNGHHSENQNMGSLVLDKPEPAAHPSRDDIDIVGSEREADEERNATTTAATSENDGPASVSQEERNGGDPSYENHHDDYDTDAPEESHRDVSMFSALTELLFNPFMDGYCRTPFCSDGDWTPSCPSASVALHTTPQENESRDYYAKPSRQYPEEGNCAANASVGPASSSDKYGDICMSESGASSVGVSSVSKKKKSQRQRPLALAVGYGDYWKDMEGRRVVITPSSSRHRPHHNRGAAVAMCTCNSSGAGQHGMSPEKEGHDISPHQTKSVMCKHCSNTLKDKTRLQPLPGSPNAAMRAGRPLVN